MNAQTYRECGKWQTKINRIPLMKKEKLIKLLEEKKEELKATNDPPRFIKHRTVFGL